MAVPLTSISPEEAFADSPPPPPSHPHPPPPPPTTHHSRQQRKGGVTKAWLVVESDGTSSVQDFGKHAIMRLTGLPGRDLRILDPMLSYPSTVLGRERAIVVKLEQIKAIITASEVLVLNYKDPLVAPFVRDLQLRVTAFPNVSSSGKAREIDGAELKDVTGSSNHSSPLSCCSIDPHVMEIPPQLESSTPDLKDKSGWHMNDDAPKEGNTRWLPFEFRALEACLEFACRCLESEALTLEQEAYPALDELTSKISTLNLERVRQIKSRLVAISGRVQKVRDELEQLLDDDMDMAEMYLTDKLNLRQAEVASSVNEIDVNAIEPDEEGDDNSSYNSRGSNENLTFAPNIEELEMLLEAYFVQIEGILNKLSALREYVDDTEDYINIMLDDKQNQLLQMGVMLSTATLITSAGIAVVGLMGMNIHISLYDATPSRKFLETVIGCVASCVLLFLTIVAWGKKKGLLS